MKSKYRSKLGYGWRLAIAIFMIGGIWLFSRLQAPINPSKLLPDLQKSGFSRYVNQPSDETGVVSLPNWDVYVFSKPEYQCVMGGDFGLLTHTGKESTRTILWMPGGQECWPDHPNCSTSSISAEEALKYEADGLDGGPLGPAHPDAKNPVSGWNYVYVPACNGSFFMGDAQADYNGDGTADHWHNGLHQVSAAVNVMKERYPKTKEILIFGSSTGGFGTFAAIPVARLAFPQARIYVLNDSGPGLFNPQKPEIWQEVRKTWGLDSIFPTGCSGCSRQLAMLYGYLLDNDPNLKIGLFSSYSDAVVANVVGMDSDLYRSTLMEETDNLSKTHPESFKRFFVKGDSHTIGDFYRKVNGVTVWDWMSAMVNSQPEWKDVLQ